MDIPGGARVVALILHPHPDFGGDRLHPFVDGLFRLLPGDGIGAARFDFTTSDAAGAAEEALDAAGKVAPYRLVLVGYSFGAGIASRTDDPRVAGWFLLAPQLDPLASSSIGSDDRPKVIAVPERDQFAPPDAVAGAVAAWRATTVTTLDGVDHFLGDAADAVAAARRAVAEIAGGVAG